MQNQVCQEAGTQVEFESEEEDSKPEVPRKKRKTNSSNKGVSFTIKEISDGIQRTYLPLKLNKHGASSSRSTPNVHAQKFPTASKSAASLLNMPSNPEMKTTEVQTSEPIASQFDDSTADVQESPVLEAQETASEEITTVKTAEAATTTAVEKTTVERLVVATASKDALSVEPTQDVQSVTKPSQGVEQESTAPNAVPDTGEESIPVLSQGEKGEGSVATKPPIAQGKQIVILVDLR